MYTLREKIEDAVYDVQDGVNYITGTDTIMQIIENHIEWTDPDECPYKHIYAGPYEITNGFTLYFSHEDIGEYGSYNEAKQAAQTHKEGRG